MILKITNLILLLLSVVWLSRTPDWEPLIAFLTLLFAYLFQEVRDHKKWSGVDSSMEHDKSLFLKYDKILPEDKLLFLLDNNIYNNWVKYSEVDHFVELLSLAKNTEGQFLNKKTNKVFKKFLTDFSNLKEFIGTHFFVKDTDDSNPESWVLELYPELKYSNESEQRQIYQKREQELRGLIDITADSYKGFRQRIKSTLHI